MFDFTRSPSALFVAVAAMYRCAHDNHDDSAYRRVKWRLEAALKILFAQETGWREVGANNFTFEWMHRAGYKSATDGIDHATLWCGPDNQIVVISQPYVLGSTVRVGYHDPPKTFAAFPAWGFYYPGHANLVPIPLNKRAHWFRKWNHFVYLPPAAGLGWQKQEVTQAAVDELLKPITVPCYDAISLEEARHYAESHSKPLPAGCA